MHDRFKPFSFSRPLPTVRPRLIAERSASGLSNPGQNALTLLKTGLITLFIALSLPCYADNNTSSGQSNATVNDVEKSLLLRENQRYRKELNALKRKQRLAEQKAKEEAAKAEQGPSETLEMVKLPNGLSVGKYEVTQAQWRAVTGNNPAKFTACGDACPVEQVSWEEVQAFIQQLNSKTGKHYRLLTEAEWQTACQAGNMENAFCGGNIADTVAWSKENANASTNPVGKKQPNAWGLYDMSGNVWEWTSDCDGSNCAMHVIRGGSWFNSDTFLTATSRDTSSGSHRFDDIGFRLALDHN